MLNDPSTIRMTDELFKQMKNDVQTSQSATKHEEWSMEIKEKLISRETKDVHLTTDECLRSDGSNILGNHPKTSEDTYDLYLLGIQGTPFNKENLIKEFNDLKIILWLKKELCKEDNFMHHGTVRERLHNSVLDDPTPRRVNIAKLVKNLFSWIKELGPENTGISVERPKHSEKLILNAQK